MTDPRMNVTYDFEGDDDCTLDDKERYARPILDGNNKAYYGFGYEYDDLDHLFVDGSECYCTCDTRGEVFVISLHPILAQRRRIPTIKKRKKS